MAVICRIIQRNRGTAPFSRLQMTLLNASLFIPLAISAQNAPAGPLTPATPSDQTPATRVQTPVASSGAHPHLAGTWQLNKKQSDDPREKMREAHNEQPEGGGRGRWGGAGMGGGRQRQGEGNDMTKEYSQLNITQTDSMAKVTNESGRVLALYSSADQSTNQSAGSEPNQSNNSEEHPQPAQWQQDRLVVTTQTRGGSATRSYELSPDGKQLYMTTRIENQRFGQPVVIRFVYDPIKSSE